MSEVISSQIGLAVLYIMINFHRPFAAARIEPPQAWRDWVRPCGTSCSGALRGGIRCHEPALHGAGIAARHRVCGTEPQAFDRRRRTGHPTEQARWGWSKTVDLAGRRTEARFHGPRGRDFDL